MMPFLALVISCQGIQVSSRLTCMPSLQSRSVTDQGGALQAIAKHDALLPLCQQDIPAGVLPQGCIPTTHRTHSLHYSEICTEISKGQSATWQKEAGGRSRCGTGGVPERGGMGVLMGCRRCHTYNTAA